MKHNKKRNTAFIYESLVRELTKAIVAQNVTRRNDILDILKENFVAGGPLMEELGLYRILVETKNTQPVIAEKLLHETKVAHRQIDTDGLFGAQSKVIGDINKHLGATLWNNFVSNYKSLASINAIFNGKTPVKKKVLFEQAIIDSMVSPKNTNQQKMKPVDNLVYRSFIAKFNDKYNTLLEEQKEFLNKYIVSFADDGAEFNLYLNQELGRLKKALYESVTTNEDGGLIRDKTEAVLNYLEEFRTRQLEQADFQKILQVQELIRELNTND